MEIHGLIGLELNSNIFGNVKTFGFADIKKIAINVKSSSFCYGVILICENQTSTQNPYCIQINKSTNVTIGNVSVVVENNTIQITFISSYTHCFCILGGSISKGIVTASKE